MPVLCYHSGILSDPPLKTWRKEEAGIIVQRIPAIRTVQVAASQVQRGAVRGAMMKAGSDGSYPIIAGHVEGIDGSTGVKINCSSI